MESFGILLREKREEKNLTIEAVARDTIISRRYIEALETENVEVFPGHTYLMGFLRNYSDYLGLDTLYMIKLFQGKVIQEAPPPENLIIHRKVSSKAVVAIVLSSLLVLCATAFILVYLFIILPQKMENNTGNLENNQSKEYTLSSIPFQRRLYKGDTLKMLISDEIVVLTVSDTLSALALETPIGLQFVELGEELEINVDGKNGADIVVFLSDVSNTNEALGAEVRMFLKADGDTAPAVASLENFDSIPLESDSSLAGGVTQKVVLQDNRPYPFTMNISFRGVCLFRYRSDSNDTIEDLFTSGDTLIMQAQNGLRLWMSNANAVKIEIIADGRTYDLEIGRSGQVLVQDVRWIREANDVYKLVVRDVD